MTDWRKAQGSQADQPAEFDTTTSAVIVYQRRNIERLTLINADGRTTELWQYEEREMSHAEYTDLKIEQNRADIDYISMETGVDL